MARGKQTTSDKLNAHQRLRQSLSKVLPAAGSAKLTITVEDAVALLADHAYLVGQVEGLREGGQILKKLLDERNR